MAEQKQQTLAQRFVAYMLENKPDLFFKILRNTVPVLVSPNNGPVFVTRFNDVQEALSRPDIFRVTYAPMMDPSVGPFMLGRDCTTINERDKGIMRSLLRKEDLPRVRETVARLTKAQIEANYANRKFNVVSEISRMVPVMLTGEYFGFPGPDTDTMKAWSRATQYDMFHNLDSNEQIHQDNIEAGKQMHEYLRQMLPERREQLKTNPDMDDTVSRLLRSHFVESIEFDEQRTMSNIMGLLVGGVETTSQAIVQILEQLFARPNELAGAIEAAKADDDKLMYQYCWEALRFNPINPFVVRKASQDYRIASGTFRSKVIKKDSIVLISGRSAMRDGRQVPVADSFCLDRPAYHYMHMGYGEHTCLGDNISRVQVPEIVKHLLLLPNVRQVAEADFEGGPFPERYEIAFD